MELKTQICTNKEQSERLIALGLKKETADLWLTTGIVGYMPTAMVFSGCEYTATENKLCSDDIPAWSLHRVIAMCPPCIIDIRPCLHKTILDRSLHYCEENNKEEFEKSFSVHLNLYDNIIDCIEWLIKEGYFPKEYLEQ